VSDASSVIEIFSKLLFDLNRRRIWYKLVRKRYYCYKSSIIELKICSRDSPLRPAPGVASSGECLSRAFCSVLVAFLTCSRFFFSPRHTRLSRLWLRLWLTHDFTSPVGIDLITTGAKSPLDQINSFFNNDDDQLWSARLQ
jgi:hypothetical protein